MTGDVRQELVALLPRLRRFAYSLTGSMDDANDLVQAACERALTRLDQFQPGTRLDSWMFRIVQTVWIDMTRYAGRRRKVNDEEALERVPHDARIHESVEARADLAIVRRTVADMPEDQRAVLALVVMDGMSYQEAATTLQVPIGTIMSRLSRARRKLAEAVDTGSSPVALKPVVRKI